ncbi:class I SAM-dependent methyltransferase [Paenibacillus sp. JX-17]|uniref:Class I SAM-dependent methyltransferase n=1 Tax=Paenibacillus lacisoli TaxID=3064525 RepID=A0ABT9C6S2_9BACL|nr:class I SAM-dependent methyltransferase [Paenibacillus sp. JX-17]MDO7904953.1 class I SAM-dependent methyltransferase [Paenibacillus sp. JX-17]
MLITTGDTDNPELFKRAASLAEHTGSCYVPRRGMSLGKLVQRSGGEQDVIVVIQNGARLVRPGQDPLTFHPSMGFIRAKRILKGEQDPMLEAARLEPGDTVLDCTAGLGTDSLLFSVGTGRDGKVIAIESSESLYALLKEGMSYYRSGLQAVDEALSRIELHRSEHLDILREMPDRSADVIYFDPMFRDPILDSSSISPLRMFANPEALAEESIREACRVARKTVVLKEKRDSTEFARLGFTKVERGQTKTIYGVIHVDRLN